MRRILLTVALWIMPHLTFSADIVIVPGITNWISMSRGLCARTATSTNLTDVVLYERRMEEGLVKRAESKTADISLKDTNTAVINMRSVVLYDTDSKGNPKIVKAELYPVSISIPDYERITKENTQLMHLHQKAIGRRTFP